ncbi:MAG: AlpA family phage regulatory protein [Rhodomicrobium sp.]
MNTGDAILRFADVSAKVGLRRTELYKLRAQGKFPNPVSLGKRAVGWRASELDAWIAKRNHRKPGETASPRKAKASKSRKAA